MAHQPPDPHTAALRRAAGREEPEDDETLGLSPYPSDYGDDPPTLHELADEPERSET